MKSRRTIPVHILLAAALLAGLLGRIAAGDGNSNQPPGAARARGMLVEDAKNDSPGFLVRVGVDHPDHTYRVGDEMHVTVSSERDGYLYLIYLDSTKHFTCLFPNRAQSDNAIKAGNPSVTIPQPGAGFRLRVTQPAGDEVLKAIVTLKPLEELQLSKLTQGDFTALSLQEVKAVAVELEGKGQVGWAEHFIDIHTVGDSTAKPPARRVGLFIGISQYGDSRIPRLTVAHKDAQGAAAVMKQSCRLDDARILLNDQANRKNIEYGLCHWLPENTRPGDTVIIYWSGHGGRMADTQGRHKDGFAEYLVPADGSLEDADAIRKSMVQSDTFGRWLQYLDGRRVVIVLDTCHSGGQAEEGRKGLGDPKSGPSKPWGTQFLQTLTRTKDIGHKEMALLASSAASQVSFERREGDYSVMTYFLIQELQGGNGPVTLPGAFNGLKEKVVKYVEENFPGGTQEPHLVDYTTPPMYLRP